MRHAAPGPAHAQLGRREGGRRRAGRARPSEVQGQPSTTRWQQLPYWLTVAGAVAALLIIKLGTHLLKSGTLVLAGVLLIAAIARLVLPDRRAGMLATRRRLLDVAVFAVFGIGLLVAGLGVQAPAG